MDSHDPNLPGTPKPRARRSSHPLAPAAAAPYPPPMPRRFPDLRLPFRLPALLLAALPLAALTGAAAPTPDAGDTPALRPGLYEVTVEIVSAEPPLPADILARAHAALPPTRQCMRRGRDRVGDTMQNGHCRYTHVDESGGRVRRLAVCDGGAVTHETDGTRTEESYDYTIVSRFAPPQASIFTGRERGRRIGDCPAP